MWWHPFKIKKEEFFTTFYHFKVSFFLNKILQRNIPFSKNYLTFGWFFINEKKKTTIYSKHEAFETIARINLMPLVWNCEPHELQDTRAFFNKYILNTNHLIWTCLSLKPLVTKYLLQTISYVSMLRANKLKNYNIF
jgi:hypothetical protein